MGYGIRYLRPGYRKPVRRPRWFPGLDVQGVIPAGWCVDCDAEVYAPGKDRCQVCLRKDGYEDEEECKSLFALCPCQ